MASVTAAPRAFRLPGSPGVRVVLAEAGLACCTLEVEAAVAAGLLVADEPGADPAGPGEQVVLLVSGTVTRALAPAVVALHEGLAGSRARVRVLAVGACASTGGPYWDAPTVVPGVDRVLAVDGYLPGCPPSPTALVAALQALDRRDAGEEG